MSINLIVVSGIFSLLIVLFILYLIKKENVNIKYSLVWLVLFVLLLICLFIPGLLEFITKLFGFQTSSNMVLSLLIAVLVVINIANTVINTHQDRKIRLLIQEVSILKKNVSMKNEK